MLGPEGLAFDAQGNLYVGDAQATVWKFERGGPPAVYANLDLLQPPAGFMPGAWCSTRRATCTWRPSALRAGSILKRRPGEERALLRPRYRGCERARASRRDNRHLWVSDDSRSGRVLRYPLGGPDPAQPDIVVQGLSIPTGSPSGRDDAALFVGGDLLRQHRACRTCAEPAAPPDTVTQHQRGIQQGHAGRAGLRPAGPEPAVSVCGGEPARGCSRSIDLAGGAARGGQALLGVDDGRAAPAPRPLLIRDGYLYFTDLWACSPLRLLAGRPDVPSARVPVPAAGSCRASSEAEIALPTTGFRRRRGGDRWSPRARPGR